MSLSFLTKPLERLYRTLGDDSESSAYNNKDYTVIRNLGSFAEQIQNNQSNTPMVGLLQLNKEIKNVEAVLLSDKTTQDTHKQALRIFKNSINSSILLEFLKQPYLGNTLEENNFNEFLKDLNLGLFLSTLEKVSISGELKPENMGRFIQCLDALLEKEENNKVIIHFLLGESPLEYTLNAGEIVDLLKKYIESIIDKKYSNNFDVESINRLINNKILPLIVIGNESAGNEILNATPPKELNLAALPFAELMGTFAEIAALLNKFSDPSFLEKRKVFDIVKNKIKELQDNNYPHILHICSCLESRLSPIEEGIKSYEKQVQKLKEGAFEKEIQELRNDTYEYKNSEIHSFLEEYFMIQEEYALVAKLVLARVDNKYKQDVPNKNLYLMIMDKLRSEHQNDYGNLDIRLAPKGMQLAIERMLSEKEIPALKKGYDISKDLIEPLKQIIILESLGAGIKTEQFSNEIIKNIQNLKVGDITGVPINCFQHATVALIKRKDEDDYEIYHYNTGNGIREWHHQWKHSNKYQTCDAIVGIPLNSLLNREAWLTILNNSYGGNMTAAYITLRNVLGKGGQLLPASTNEEDYEVIQSAESCTIQRLMAMLRHQIILRGGGTPAENEALYKAIKMRLFIEYEKIFLPKADENITKMIGPVLKKIKTDLEFSEMAENKEKTSQALKRIAQALTHANQEIWAQQVLHYDTSTSLARYAALRNASKLLSLSWLKDPSKFNAQEANQADDLRLALAKFEHKEIIYRNIENRLIRAANDPELFIRKVINELIYYPNSASQSFLKYFAGGFVELSSEQKMDFSKTFVSTLKKVPPNFKENVEEIIQSVIQGLKESKQDVLAHSIHTSWTS